MRIESFNFVILLFVTFLAEHGNSQRRNRSPRNLLFIKAQPCEKFVHIESHGILNYLGNITFLSPVNFKGRWHLEMSTKEPFTFLGGWGVTIKEDGANKYADFFSSKIAVLRIGDPITFRFRISYARGMPIPYVSLLKWEGHSLCGRNTGPTSNFRTGHINSATSIDNRNDAVKTNYFEDHVRRRYGITRNN